MELVEWDIPLQILADKPDIQSIVIGELTIEEGLIPITSQIESTSAKGVKMRRDVTQDAACMSRHNTNISDTLTHQTYTKKDSKLISTVKIAAVKMNIINPNESYQVTQQQLLQLPKSRYRPDNYYKKLLSPRPEVVSSVPSIHADSDATLLYSSSDETIPYQDHGEDNASACT